MRTKPLASPDARPNPSMPHPVKPPASLSLDLDDKWTYMKTHGDPRWASFPSYLETVVPRILAFLKERGLTITFFLVGQDAVLERNHSVLRQIADAGHEIANHSFHHEPWLHTYSKAEIETEIQSAADAIERATGCVPVGFRGPGFSVSTDVIETLIEQGYRYDCSTLPTFIGPFARAYYFLTAKLDSAEQEKRALLFGTFKDGLRPLKVHEWETARGALPEIPVTTIPILRSPFHLSYLLYLSSFSPALSRTYLRLATLLCHWRDVQPSFLLHSLDFAGPDEAPELTFFPGMKLSLDHKLSVADWTLSVLSERFQLVPMKTHVQKACAASGFGTSISIQERNG